MEVFFSPEYLACETEFDTTRKADEVAAALHRGSFPGVRLKEPLVATRAELLRVHDEDFVDAVLSGEPEGLASSAGLGWDEGLATSVLASTGGCRDAAIAAWRDGVAGSLSSGLHHAARAQGAGYCTFNGIAVAALAFLDQGAPSVLVLDLDAHCGGGTADILGPDPRVLQADVATSSFDRYRPRQGWTLDHVTDAEDYLPATARRLDALDPSAIGAVVYNAGMDPHEGCDTGGLDGITDDVLAEREQMVFAWAATDRLPLAFVLAGGYQGRAMTREHLVRLHLLTVGAATEAAGTW